MNASLNIYAVVVTYNRFKLLQRAIGYLRRQTQPLAGIVVVNNGSTDGTHEWLDQQTDLTVVHQDNVGGSGGFYTGIKKAYELGADWLWCMDDDVYPAEDCLETLCSYIPNHPEIGIYCPQRICNGHITVGETEWFNLTNPLKPLHKFLSVSNLGNDELIGIEGMTFEGPFISRAVIDKIGLPNKELFILYDDTDFSFRAIRAGFKVVHCQKATLHKEYFPPKAATTDEFVVDWKTFYFVRNMSYFAKEYGETFVFRTFGGIRFFLHNLWDAAVYCKKGKLKEMRKIIRAFNDGKRKQLGKINF